MSRKKLCTKARVAMDYTTGSTFSQLHHAPCVFSGERASLADGHTHFGQPAKCIVRHVLSKFHLPLASNKNMTVYPVCHPNGWQWRISEIMPHCCV
jgi:hypothetical protein